LVLALTARGLGTCVHLAIAGYPEIVHEQLNIPEELMILCGLAAGYSDPDFLANQLRIGRNAIEKNVVFLRLLADS
jgi:nitroreductase